MSCASFTFSLPSLASVTVWGLIAALAFWSGCTWTKIRTDRQWATSITKAAAQMVDAPHFATGEPFYVPTRVDPKSAIFAKRRFIPYSGHYPTEEGYQGPDERIAA